MLTKHPKTGGLLLPVSSSVCKHCPKQSLKINYIGIIIMMVIIPALIGMIVGMLLKEKIMELKDKLVNKMKELKDKL